MIIVHLYADTHRYAVHGQICNAIQEVCKGQINNVDGGVFERGSVEAKDFVGLSPRYGQQG